MDLTNFCSKDESRPYLMQPWTRGEWTYATDGRMLVRVTARATVPDNEKAPDAGKLFSLHPIGDHIPLPAVKIPEVDPQAECDECGGRGTDHDCPSCTCTCNECGGSGQPPRGLGITVGVNKSIIQARYFLLLQTLPNVEITTPEDFKDAIHFRFDGGDGLLMMTSQKSYDQHIEAMAA